MPLSVSPLLTLYVSRRGRRRPRRCGAGRCRNGFARSDLDARGRRVRWTDWSRTGWGWRERSPPRMDRWCSPGRRRRSACPERWRRRRCRADRSGRPGPIVDPRATREWRSRSDFGRGRSASSARGGDGRPSHAHGRWAGLPGQLRTSRTAGIALTDTAAVASRWRAVPAAPAHRTGAREPQTSLRHDPSAEARYGQIPPASGSTAGTSSGGGTADGSDSAIVMRGRIARCRWAVPSSVVRGHAGNAKIPATTYFPERLPSQYLRRWRA